MPVAVIKTLFPLSHLILITTLWDKYSNSCFFHMKKLRLSKVKYPAKISLFMIDSQYLVPGLTSKPVCVFLTLTMLRVLSWNWREISILMSEWMSQSHSVVSDSLRSHGLYSPWNSPGKNTEVGSLSLLQGIFPTQGSNPGLPLYRRILYHKEIPQGILNHKGRILIHEHTNFCFWKFANNSCTGCLLLKTTKFSIILYFVF